MADDYAVKGAMKGLLAGVRGVVAGKLAVKNAQTATARKEAMIALENRRQNMADAKAFFEKVRLEGEGGEQDKMEQDKIEQERSEDLNTDYEEAEEDLTGLEDDVDMEMDPDKRKMIREKISTKRSRLLRIASRMGKRRPGIEASKKPESADPSPEEGKKKKADGVTVPRRFITQLNKIFGKLGRNKKSG